MKVCVLGASRGLGLEFAKQLVAGNELFLSARRMTEVKHVFPDSVQLKNFDFSKESNQEKILSELTQWQPELVIYCAAGGPYGEFQNKKWGAHAWALNVSLVFPAKLLHWGLQQDSVQAMAFVGSAIAEAKADPKAASYSMAKHGLKGLIHSVIEEKPCKNIYLFSPGYMDTDMLPQNAEPRVKGEVILSPQKVAQYCIENIKSRSQDWHHVIEHGD